ncbi:MAG: ATP-dependent Clp protease adaptor ClpS [Nitrospirales bacterium]|nr:ATP-dependent Clp protease adaptor ClpS [Nitrospira sp.]MDR4503001.1 ATP-dependent Clp protease adaptor ClpS [Nitrospirales bacterium]
MGNRTLETPAVIEDTGIGTGQDFEAEVIVYNCNCHTYQQVIALFCEYIPGMTPARAFELAWQIDHHGSAAVYQGEQKRAEGIAKQLAGGGLRVEVRY